MAATTKRRAETFKTAPVTGESVNSSGEVTHYNFLGDTFPALKQTQVTVSENHPAWKHRADKHFVFQGDLGGEFFSQRRWMECSHFPSSVSRVMTTGPPLYKFAGSENRNGPLYAFSFTGQSYPAFNNSSDAALNALGATAIARCKPTKSAANVSTMLGETIREGIPKLIGAALWKSKTKEALKASSHEFLNFQFGWLPLVDDIVDISMAISNADAILRQYGRDSGKLVRRRYEFPPIESTTSSFRVGSSAYMPNYSFGQIGGPGRCVHEVITSKRQWFSGAFTYYLPRRGNALDSMARDALEANKLLGLSLTPETIWNLTPWSWAVDWFSNAGDVVSNLSSWMMDSLCLQYGYMMEHSRVEHRFSWTGPAGFAPDIKGGGPVNPWSMIVETKIRKRANPFGFGIKWSGLSPIQYAIAAALGISRR